MTTYTYTVYDGDPATSGPCSWPSHDDIEIEAANDEDALAEVRDIVEIAAAGLSIADGYTVGQRLYATVWDADETIVGQVTHDLTAEDLSEAAEAQP
jgi:hypothetical protein